MTDVAPPKMFISYSWSNPDHEAWVVELAEELVSQGVEVKLDKWDLQPGHDANAFMESMVTDPAVTKVLMICDRVYVEKSNSRSGGAGAEAQILTPSLYKAQAQDKFVAVIRERDAEGNAFVPAYYGSRIYIDLSDPAIYAAEFDRLLRWAYDQPLYVRPKAGTRPAFLDARAATRIATSVEYRRAVDAVRGGAANAAALAGEYFAALARGLEAFRIAVDNENRATFDDVVVQSLDDFTPYRNEAVELLALIAQHSPDPALFSVVHRFFEALLPYTERTASTGSYTDVDFDNFRFIANELFLYAVAAALKFERFELAQYLIDTEYYWQQVNGYPTNMHRFTAFSLHVRALELRNQRLNTNLLSMHADQLKSRNSGAGVEFRHVMTADLILFLRAMQVSGLGSWWPDTLLYVDHYGGAFELFARAKSAKYFDRMTALLGVDGAAAFKAQIEQLVGTPGNLPRWQHRTIALKRVTGADLIGSAP